MTFYETLTLVLGFMSIILIPSLALLIRFTAGWAKTGERLDEIGKDLRQLVADKDKVHREMLEQMKEDRNATNQRLTWLERNLWARRRGGQDVG